MNKMKKQKAALRETCLQQRNRKTEEERRHAGQQAAALLQHSPLLVPASHISAYWPVHGEFDVRPVIAMLHGHGKACALPVIPAPKLPLQFRLYHPGDTLAKDAHYGMYQPLAAAKEVTPNLLLVPLLAFDRAGLRLGLGGGYYDRTLAALKNASHRFTAIGVGYAECELPALPKEPHDFALDYVLTEKEIITCGEKPA